MDGWMERWYVEMIIDEQCLFKHMLCLQTMGTFPKLTISVSFPRQSWREFVPYKLWCAVWRDPEIPSLFLWEVTEGCGFHLLDPIFDEPFGVIWAAMCQLWDRIHLKLLDDPSDCEGLGALCSWHLLAWQWIFHVCRDTAEHQYE